MVTATEKKRILLIDDEETFTRYLKLNLEATGAYEVRTEHRGQQGLAAARAFHPDLILLDIVMPDMDGIAVAEQLTADPRTQQIPIVFLTATVLQKEVEATGGLIGGRPFLAKPVMPADVIQSIQQHLRR